MEESNDFGESIVPEFPLFLSLPQEIRHIIWGETLLPRLIPLHCSEYNSDPTKDSSNTYRLYNSQGLPTAPAQPLVLLPGREVRFTISRVPVHPG